MNTDELIERLAREVEPVRPLRPWISAGLWSALAGLYVAVLVAMLASASDFAANTANRGFFLQQIAAVALAMGAVTAAFASVVPGSSPGAVLLPVLGGSFWLATLIAGSREEWRAAGVAGLADPHELLCVATIAVTALPPAIAMVLMLRRGAALTPRLTTAFCVLAAAGFANVVACVGSPHRSALAVLVWHGLTLGALCITAAIFGRLVLPWNVLPGRERTPR